jgi:release factor glutamine methyltransferase
VNRDRLQLDVALVVADLLGGLGTRWDAIVSNPPYVTEGERAALPRDVRDHEPAEALFGGEDGLDIARELARQAGSTEATLLALEIGAGQSGAVRDLVRAAGFRDVTARRDLAGIERVVVGRRRAT